MFILAAATESGFLTLKSLAAIIHVIGGVVWLIYRRGSSGGPGEPIAALSEAELNAARLLRQKLLTFVLQISLALALGMAGRFGILAARGKWKPEMAEDLAGVALLFVVPAVIQYLLGRQLVRGSRTAGLVFLALASTTVILHALLFALFYLARAEFQGNYWLRITAVAALVSAAITYLGFVVWRGTGVKAGAVASVQAPP